MSQLWRRHSGACHNEHVDGGDSDSSTKDVALVYGKNEEGDGLRVLRQRGDVIEAGEVRPVESGKPLAGDLIRLTRRPEHPLLFSVEVLAETGPARQSSGPAQVATRAYREGWDALFGKPDRDLN